MKYSDLVLDMFYQGKITKDEALKLLNEQILRLNFEVDILNKKIKTIENDTRDASITNDKREISITCETPKPIPQPEGYDEDTFLK